MHPFQRHKGVAVTSIAQQVDTSAAVPRSDLVLTQELAGDAQQARRLKVDVGDATVTKLLPHKFAEFRLMVFQPVEIVQALIDDILILAPLVRCFRN